MIRASLGAAAFCASLAVAAGAQSWRTLDAAGMRPDSSSVAVQIDYTRGQLRTRPTESAGTLYDLHLRYDATRSHPLLSYDSTARTLSIGAQARPDARAGGDGRNTGEAILQLGRSSPMDIAVRLDVATATLDFGGMALHKLSVQSSASEVRLGFDAPNTTAMDGLDLDVSAATLTAVGLANANTNRLRVGARAGGAELHLDGAWKRDLEVDLDIALGSVTIHVPADVGVQLDVRRIFAQIDAGGLQRSGDQYVSANWNTATRKVRIRASATLGKLELIHGAR
jgi:hypothetical protein